jgi:anti-sigma factor RsiW
MNHSDDMATRYLFGELPESQRAEMEAAYFDDPLAFDRLERLENDLIDKYVRGRLDPATRARLEQAYLRNPNRRARLKFAEALAARLDQYEAQYETPLVTGAARAGSRRRRLFASPSPALAFSMAAAFVLLVLASTWLLIEYRRLRAEVVRRDDAQALREQHEAGLQRQLDEEQKRNQELAAELERASGSATAQTKPLPESEAPGVVTLLLAANVVRGAETASPPTLVIPKGTEHVRVQLALKDNEYSSYQIVLRAVAGSEIFKGQNLKPRVNKSGSVFSLSVPPAKFTTGDYMLTLRGAVQNGELEDVSKSLFRVEKK